MQTNIQITKTAVWLGPMCEADVVLQKGSGPCTGKTRLHLTQACDFL